MPGVIIGAALFVVLVTSPLWLKSRCPQPKTYSDFLAAHQDKHWCER